MNDTPSIISQKEIENRTFTIRGLQVVFMESHFAIPSKQSLGGILFEGQLLDAYVFVANIIKKATPDTFAGIITFAKKIKSQINVIHQRLSQKCQACASPFHYKGRAGDGYKLLTTFIVSYGI